MSLKWKTALIVFLASLVVVTLAAEYLLRMKSAETFQQQQQQHFQLLEQLTHQAEQAFASGSMGADDEMAALQEVFQSYARLPQYQGFYLLQNGQVLIAHQAGAELPSDASQQKFIKDIPAMHDTHVLLIPAPQDDSLTSELLISGYWFLLLIAILLLTLTGYFTGHRLAVKIDQLIVGISKAGGGNYSQHISSSGDDEITQLVISYNRMLDNMLLATQEMKEQLQNYKSILDTAAEGIVSLNDRGVIQEYNQSAKEIFGYPPEDIIGKNITLLIPSRIEQAQQETVTQNCIDFEQLSEKYLEVIGTRQDGQNFPIDLSISVSMINNRQVFTCIIRDISEQKQRETEQKNLEIQLRMLQRQQTVESLTGGIAHDFNNILGPVLGYADMALSDAEDGTKQQKYLKYILDGAHKARELVARIMNFTRQYEISREQLHLTSVVEEALEFFKLSSPSEHKIETFINTNDDMVAAEKTQLQQVLVTMMTNAYQAMENQVGTLSIRLDTISVGEELLAQSSRLHEGDYLRLRIQDTGIGMDPLTRASVFEPFFTTHDNKKSSGLGLSVAYGIINNFGGEILVDSELGKGSEFTIYLPLITSKEIKREGFIKPKPLSKRGESILYIDDDDIIVELGKEMLKSLGYEVDVSTSSEKALQIFRNNPEDFDMIITDQSMPVLTGTQLAREIKKIRPDIPIVLVTGFSASVLNQELADSGIDQCIAKPVVIDELGEIVLQVFDKYKTS